MHYIGNTSNSRHQTIKEAICIRSFTWGYSQPSNAKVRYLTPVSGVPSVGTRMLERWVQKQLPRRCFYAVWHMADRIHISTSQPSILGGTWAFYWVNIYYFSNVSHQISPCWISDSFLQNMFSECQTGRYFKIPAILKKINMHYISWRDSCLESFRHFRPFIFLSDNCLKFY